MKILQINAVYGAGSTGKMARDISDKLVSSGHQSYVMWAINCKNEDENTACIRIGSTLDHKIHALLYRIFGGQGMYSRHATRKACKKIKEISPDVVHLHNLHSNFIHIPTLFEFLAKHNIPTLITLHDCWFLGGYCMHYKNHNCSNWREDCRDCPAVSGRFKKTVEKQFALRRKLYSDFKHLAVNGVSMWTKEAAECSILKSASRIECIYNWVDTNIFAPRDCADEIKRKYGIPKERKLILGVSQVWYPEKGVDSFLYLAERFSDVADILLVGEDKGVPSAKNIHCIGFAANTDELVDLYSAADVLVNASNAETFGLVTAEAMACGTPVVSYSNGGSSELITDECGVVVQNGNKEELAAGIENVLGQGKTSFAHSCRQRVENNFAKDKQIEKYIELYIKISKKH